MKNRSVWGGGSGREKPLCWQDKYNNGLRKVGALQTLYNAVRVASKRFSVLFFSFKKLDLLSRVYKLSLVCKCTFGIKKKSIRPAPPYKITMTEFPNGPGESTSIAGQPLHGRTKAALRGRVNDRGRRGRRADVT